MRKFSRSLCWGVVGGTALFSSVASAAPSKQAPSKQGPSHQGPSYQGPSTQGPASQGPGAQGPASQGPASQGPSTQGPGAQGPASQGPSTQGPASQGPSVQGPGAQAPAAQGPGRQGPGSYSLGTQAPFPNSWTHVGIGYMDGGTWVGADWRYSESWIQFVTDVDSSSGDQVFPAWTEDAQGVRREYRKYSVVDGRLGFYDNAFDTVPTLSGDRVLGGYIRAYIVSADRWVPAVLRIARADVDSTTTTIPNSAPGNPAGAWGTNNKSTDHLRYSLQIFGWPGRDGARVGAARWLNICGIDRDNDAGAMEDNPDGYGILYSGTFLHYSGDYIEGGLGYACDGGTINKAMRVFGYKPWESFGIASSQISGRKFGELQWINATRALMGDYCENNVGLTRYGTFVDVFDNYRINQPYDNAATNAEYAFGFESEWASSTTADFVNATPTTTLDCTVDFTKYGEPPLAPYLPTPACSSAGVAGSKADLRTLNNLRYTQMKPSASCLLSSSSTPYFPVSAPSYDNISDPYAAFQTPQPQVASLYVRSSTVCDHSPTSIGSPLAADCNPCAKLMATSTNYAYCTTDAYDSACVQVANRTLPVQGTTYCPVISTVANNAVQFQLGDSMTRVGSGLAMVTNKTFYQQAEPIVLTWNLWIETYGKDSIKLVNANTLAVVQTVEPLGVSITWPTNLAPGLYRFRFDRSIPSTKTIMESQNFWVAPAAPASFTATASNTQAAGSWGLVSGAPFYRMHGTHNNGLNLITPTFVSTAAGTFTGLVNGQPALLRVSACSHNIAETCGPSRDVTVTPALTPPTVLATIAQHNQVTLQLAGAVANATGYTLRRSGLIHSSNNTLSRTVTGLTNGTSSIYTFASYDASGHNSALSSNLAVTPSQGTDNLAPALVASCSTNTANCSRGHDTDASLATGWTVTTASSTWTVDLGVAYQGSTRSTNVVRPTVQCATSTTATVMISSNNSTWTSYSFACPTTKTTQTVVTNQISGRYVRIRMPGNTSSNTLFDVQAFTN